MKAVIYGGELSGEYEIEDLWKFSDGKTEDLSELRNKGLCVHCKELDNQPTLPGYCGPMFDGGKLRYETWEIYDVMTR